MASFNVWRDRSLLSALSQFLCLLCTGLLLLAPHAQAQDDQMAEGVTAYTTGDYDTTIRLFSDLAKDDARATPERREALHYLGRAYIAKRMANEARETLTELLELEPPLVELDPDMEPPPLMKLYYEVRKDVSNSYEVERARDGIQTLAIMDFTNNSVDDHERFAPMEQGFASVLIHQLNGATDLKVVERERIQWLLSELDLQQDASRVDQSTAVRMGKLMGAQAMLLGSFIKHRKDIMINARLVNVETGEILMSEQVKGRAEDFYELTQQLSLKVAQGINVTLSETTLGASTETKSLDAQISYSEGIVLLEKEEYRAAYEKFLEALEYDASYSRARLKADSIEPLLAAG